MDRNQEKPIYFYVANLGSEVQRILVWREKGDLEAMRNAYERAVGIIEKIKSLGNKSANAEMEMLSGYLGKIVSSNSEETFDRNEISSFFNPFAVRVINDFTHD